MHLDSVNRSIKKDVDVNNLRYDKTQHYELENIKVSAPVYHYVGALNASKYTKNHSYLSQTIELWRSLKVR